MARRVRRPRREKMVQVEMPESVAAALQRLTESDVLRIKHQNTPLSKIMRTLGGAVLVVVLLIILWVWGPVWEWRNALYEVALSQCQQSLSMVTEESHLNVIVTEEGVTQTCLRLTRKLKPPPSSEPWNRLVQAYDWVATPVGDWLKSLFLADYRRNVDPVRGGTPGSVDYSGESRDNLGNPTLRAVIQEAIRLQAEFDVPWRYVVDACFYESGGLRQYASPGVLVQGRNLNDDGSLSSTDWGMCQINDYWQPHLMELAKGTWQTNLRAGFTVMNARWPKALEIEDGEYRLRYLWGRYNGSGPYDTYANRVWAVHNTLEQEILDILRSFLSPPRNASGKTVINGGVEVSIDLSQAVDQYDGQRANLETWAINNSYWTISPGGEWHFCGQTDSTGWSDYVFAADIEAGGICYNTSQIDEAVKLFGPGLTVVEQHPHAGSWPYLTKAVDCPAADYVIRNDTAQEIAFEYYLKGDILTLRVGYAGSAQPTSTPSTWTEFWRNCPADHSIPCGFPLLGYPTSYVVGEKRFHEGAWDYFRPDHGSTEVYATVSGSVTQWGRFDNGGNNGGTTYLTVSNGTCSVTYYHMPLESMISLNSPVSWGDVIGKMGNEGVSDWTHLHYSIDCGSGPVYSLGQYWDPYLPTP